jgi:hypothetical protein
MNLPISSNLNEKNNPKDSDINRVYIKSSTLADRTEAKTQCPFAEADYLPNGPRTLADFQTPPPTATVMPIAIPIIAPTINSANKSLTYNRCLLVSDDMQSHFLFF